MPGPRKRKRKALPDLLWIFLHPHDERCGRDDLIEKYGVRNVDAPSTTVSDRAPRVPVSWLPETPFTTATADLRDEVRVPGVMTSRTEATVRTNLVGCPHREHRRSGRTDPWETRAPGGAGKHLRHLHRGSWHRGRPARTHGQAEPLRTFLAGSFLASGPDRARIAGSRERLPARRPAHPLRTHRSARTGHRSRQEPQTRTMGKARKVREVTMERIAEEQAGHAFGPQTRN